MQNTFKVGFVANPYKKAKDISLHQRYAEVVVRYPSRLNAMAIDPGKIDVNENGIYTPGEIIFSVAIFKMVTVSARKDIEIVIITKSKRTQLIKHAVMIMQSALGIKNGFDVTVEVADDYKHCGLGSSSGLISAVACAINELYGKPISNLDLISYLAQNHGEEIDHDADHLQHVQCIGGSAAAGLVEAGMVVLAGESVPIGIMKIPTKYEVVIGIPEDFVALDAKTLMELEMANMQNFIHTGQEYGPKIAYQMVHETLPSMATGDLRKASGPIFDYRFDYGSIQNCSFVYPGMVDIAKNTRYLFEDGTAAVLALSSVGPAFFALTENVSLCVESFQENGMKTIVTQIHNDGYQVINTRE